MQGVFWATGAVAAFHLAYEFPTLSWLMIGYFAGLVQLTRVGGTRATFYLGLGVGLLTVAPQLVCFWTIFGVSAIVLWCILAFWVALFVVLARFCLNSFSFFWGTCALPFLWTGLEYFRSELYYLRFSWLNGGYAFAETAGSPLFHWLGMYGTGFLLMTVAVVICRLRLKQGALWVLRFGLLLLVGLFLYSYFQDTEPTARRVKVAGIQLEFPTEVEVITALDQLIQTAPDAELLVLSEYTFDGPIPAGVKNWCRKYQCFLVAGGKDPAPAGNFYDTAFVVGPSGEIVFRQVKSVPIQFFKDGLPAIEQRLWESPWGKIGLCVCYDLSYTRVTDRLIRMGAEALIVPTMDVVDWGRHQHELHARVAPVRSAEYRVPIFRVASSGISQWTDAEGRVRAQGRYPGQKDIVQGTLELAGPGSVPFDRWPGLFSSAVSGLVLAWCILRCTLVGRVPPRGVLGEAKNPSHPKEGAAT